MASSPGQHGRWSWSRLARLGQAAWFFGNLYEALVGMPQLLADARPVRHAGLLAAGSPVRYFAPVGMITLVPTGITLVQTWRAGADRGLITATATCAGSAVGLSTYLIRTVNVALLPGHEPLGPSERLRLVVRWHQGNAVRLVALGAATVLFSQLTKHGRCPNSGRSGSDR